MCSVEWLAHSAKRTIAPEAASPVTMSALTSPSACRPRAALTPYAAFLGTVKKLYLIQYNLIEALGWFVAAASHFC